MRICQFFLIFLVLMVSVSVFALSSAPSEIKGMSWNTHINAHSELKLIKVNGRVKEYEKDNDFQMGGIEVERITYLFYMDRFYGLEVDFKTVDNGEKIVSTLTEKYGKHKSMLRAGIEKRLWKWDAVLIMFEFNFSTEIGKVSYYYRSVYNTVSRENGDIVDKDAF